MVELLDRNDEVVDARARGALLPLAAVADAIDVVVETDRAALGDAGLNRTRLDQTIDRTEDGVGMYLGSSLYAPPEHANAVCPVVLGGALVEAVKVNGVLERAVLDQAALGYVLVVSCQAHGEAEERLGVGVELLRAELDDVAEACFGQYRDAPVRGVGVLHSSGPCLQATPSSLSVGLDGVSWALAVNCRNTYVPINDSVKLTLLCAFCIAGSTRSRRQSCSVSAT